MSSVVKIFGFEVARVAPANLGPENFDDLSIFTVSVCLSLSLSSCIHAHATPFSQFDRVCCARAEKDLYVCANRECAFKIQEDRPIR